MKKISSNVKLLSLVSFLNDIASEMVYPLIPIFLTTVLKTPVSIVGFIEGLAEFTSSILKVISGWFSDFLHRRKVFVIIGYFLSGLGKIILCFPFTWVIVLISRFVDRLGKGIRTSSRDALISVSSTQEDRGRSFGFHRAMDTAGAVIGPLIALFLIIFGIKNFIIIFCISAIFSFAGIIFLFWVKEQPNREIKRTTLNLALRNLPTNFKIFLLVTCIFSLGNSSDAFLILRVKNLGYTNINAIFFYIIYNFSYALFSYPLGIISDRIGTKKLLVSGYFLFSLIYLGFGITTQNFLIILTLYFFYGIYMALTDGIGRTYVSLLVEEKYLGTAMGLYHTTIGISIFFASLIAGFLWEYFGVIYPFIFSAITSLFSLFIFIIFIKK